MARYHLGYLDESMAAIEAPSGKRLRPALCFLVTEAGCGDWRPALPAAVALELVHNFSLVHDDIQDESLLRRFRPTVWARWGRAQGINVGDAILILAEQALIESDGLDPRARLAALKLLNRACRDLCEGQYLDLLWESQLDVSVAEYLDMIDRKTARLFQCSAELGALCAGVSVSVQAEFAAFGRALGLAFQIADDLIGAWGPEAATGKTADLDVANRKKTLPAVLGLAARASSVAERLRGLFALDRRLTTEETAEATSLLESLGARDQTVAYARRFQSEALDGLDHLAAHHDVTALRDFAGAILPRL
jgi:geranylgeranyl diphosphate synthase type I